MEERNQLSISAAKELVGFNLRTGRNTLLVGRPGIGKTAIIKQVAEDIGYDIVVMLPALEEAINYMGYPVVNGGVATMLPFQHIAKMAEAKKPLVVFFDDLGQAGDDVQKAMMHILHARMVGNLKISSMVRFVAATNDVGQGSGVSGLLEPVKSRFTSIIKMKLDIKELQAYLFGAGIPSDLVDFIGFRPEYVTDWEPSPSIEAACTPRTIEFLGQQLLDGLPERLVFNAAACSCGYEFASEYIAFREMVRFIPNLDLVATDPDSVTVPDSSKPSLVYATTVALTRMITGKNSANIFKYIDRLEERYKMLFISDATTRLGDSFSEFPGYVEWAVKNAQFMVS